MNSNARGFSLIEVFAALAVLAITALGVMGGIIIAVSTNGIAAKRTLMAQFAQARFERLVAQTRTKIPTAATVTPVNCSAMTVGGTFDPDVPPGTGGWMIDVIDGPAPVAAGNDEMWGPILVADAAAGASTGSGSSEDFVGRTIAARTAALTAWNGASLAAGCGATLVNQPGWLCREVHIEPGNAGGVPMLRAWVRVVQGGASWRTNSLTLQEDIAQ